MVTLRHAFDASSMKGLVVKILRGTYPSIPSFYSQNLRDLIDEMLEKDAHKRPSVKKILEKEFLSSRISQLLSQTVAKHEFGKVFPSKPLEEIKEDRDDRRPTPEIASEKKIRKKEVEEEKEVGGDREEKELKELKEDNIGYEEMVKSLRQCLEEKNPEDSDEFEEDANQRVKANFLTPEGVPLPGVSEVDSAYGRIEALRCYLENQLGMEKFMQAYNYLSVIFR